MRPAFHARIVNGPFGDPGLFVPFMFQNRALIFDLGDTAPLSNRDVLKITHAFVSHAHIDHFTGFDRLLRLFLGREKTFYIYGPEGFFEHLEGKLAGYVWNLVSEYQNQFVICGVEVRETETLHREYRCQDRFQPRDKTIHRPFSGQLASEPAFGVSAAILDHGIACLGFALEEPFHINILKDRVEDLGLAVGPWLNRFKEALWTGTLDYALFKAPLATGGALRFSLKDLSQQIAIISPGQKIAYIADAVYHPENEAKMVELARGADHLFIEAPFCHKDRKMAEKKWHLTARQAGWIAGQAGVKAMTVFHFSPRYSDDPEQLIREAETAWREAAM